MNQPHRALCCDEHEQLLINSNVAQRDLLKRIAIARRGDSPDVEVNFDRLPDEIEAERELSRRVEAVLRAEAANARVLRDAALAMLPETCRHHGRTVESTRAGAVVACCDTGQPAFDAQQLRQQADRADEEAGVKW